MGIFAIVYTLDLSPLILPYMNSVCLSKSDTHAPMYGWHIWSKNEAQCHTLVPIGKLYPNNVNSYLISEVMSIKNISYVS